MKRWRPLEFFGIALILWVCTSALMAQITLKVDVSLIPLEVAVYDAQDNPVKIAAMITRAEVMVLMEREVR